MKNTETLYTKLTALCPINGLLAVNITLLARILGETELAVLNLLELLGFVAHEKYSAELRIPYIRRIHTVAQYRYNAQPMHLQSTGGLPYGFDCSSFTQWAAALIGFALPRRSVEQYLVPIGELVNLNEHTSPPLRPFDIVFTTSGVCGGWNINTMHYCPENSTDVDAFTIGHCGLAIDERTIIHAANKDRGIVEESIDDFLGKNSSRQKPLRGIRRLLPSDQQVVTMIVPAHLGLRSAADIPILIRQHCKHARLVRN